MQSFLGYNILFSFFVRGNLQGLGSSSQSQYVKLYLTLIMGKPTRLALASSMIIWLIIINSHKNRTTLIQLFSILATTVETFFCWIVGILLYWRNRLTKNLVLFFCRVICSSNGPIFYLLFWIRFLFTQFYWPYRRFKRSKIGQYRPYEECQFIYLNF